MHISSLPFLTISSCLLSSLYLSSHSFSLPSDERYTLLNVRVRLQTLPIGPPNLSTDVAASACRSIHQNTSPRHNTVSYSTIKHHTAPHYIQFCFVFISRGKYACPKRCSCASRWLLHADYFNTRCSNKIMLFRYRIFNQAVSSNHLEQ